jgi:hypothetical protein
VSKRQVIQNYGKLPLSFEANRGQADSRVKFLARGSGYSLFLTGTETVLSFAGADAFRPGSRAEFRQRSVKEPQQGSRAAAARATPSTVLRMKLFGANPAARVRGLEELPGKSNYFIGNDPAKWRRNVPHYAKVKYERVYPGINLVHYGNQQQLEYDFDVAPGASPGAIRLCFEGAEGMEIDAQGDLVLRTAAGEVREHKPVVYQEIAGARREVGGKFVRRGENEVGFAVAPYDTSTPLVIDPTLSYSTYLGGNDSDEGWGIAVDTGGNAYVTGWTDSANFPTTPGSFQTAIGAVGRRSNAFVTKLNPAGNTLVFSTYLGGGADGGRGIAVDANGNAYVTGSRASTNFPVSPGAFQDGLRGSLNAFVTKLNPAGNALVYSTYLGGSTQEVGFAIAVDASRNAYLTGDTFSSDFPTTPGSFQAASGDRAGHIWDAFVTKLNPAGNALVYSTYLGGTFADGGRGIAVDADGNAYVTGYTDSRDFPTSLGSFQTTCGQGVNDAFVTKLNPAGNALVYSTYLGGGVDDLGHAVAVDADRNAYVTGDTFSTDFPITR